MELFMWKLRPLRKFYADAHAFQGSLFKSSAELNESACKKTNPRPLSDWSASRERSTITTSANILLVDTPNSIQCRAKACAVPPHPGGNSTRQTISLGSFLTCQLFLYMRRSGNPIYHNIKVRRLRKLFITNISASWEG